VHIVVVAHYCYCTLLHTIVVAHYNCCTLHVDAHYCYYMLPSLHAYSSSFHNTKSWEHEEHHKFNIKWFYLKQKKRGEGGDDGEHAHLRKDDKCNQESDIFIMKHFTWVCEAHKYIKLLSLQWMTMVGSALHTTSKNLQIAKS
jgi:hypothetical protein